MTDELRNHLSTKEITKAPVYYFCDLGLRNYTLGLAGNLSDPQNLGFLFQNLVYQILKEKIRQTADQVYFWRTKDGSEVDMVLDIKNQILPIEVKYSVLRKPEISRSLRNFISRYNPKRACVVNLDLNTKIQIDHTTIEFVSIYKFLTMTLDN